MKKLLRLKSLLLSLLEGRRKMKKILFNELFPYEYVRNYFSAKKRKVEKIIKSELDDVVEKDKYVKADKNEESR